MPRFGQFLQSRGVITRDQLEEALDHQAVHGARLGTNLVEIGAISVEKLAEALSEFHRVPLPPRRWLERPKRSALQRVTRSLVDRMRFIPMRVDGNVMHAVLLDPTNPSTLDDLRFATGCRIEPYVLPELWLHDWLFELFKMPPRLRPAGGTGGEAGDSPRKRAASVAPLTVASDDGQVPEFVSNQNAPLSVEAAFAALRTLAAAPKERSDAPPPGRLPPPPALPFTGDMSWSAPSEPLDLPPSDAAGASVRPPSPTGDNLSRSALASSPLAAAVTTMTGEPPPSGADRVMAFWESSPNEPAVALPPDEPVNMPQPKRATLAPPPPAPEATATQRASSRPLAHHVQTLPAVVPPTTAPDAPPGASEHATDEHATAVPEASAQAAPARADELHALESALLDAADRDRLVELAVTLASSFAPHVALFVVSQGTAQGLRAAARGSAHPIDDLLVPLAAPSMLSDVIGSLEPTRIDASEREVDQQLLRDVGDAHATAAAVFPVVIKQRVVNVLVASGGAAPLGHVAFAALGTVAQVIGSAYGQLILRRKARSSSA